jgi:hypothetical protein
VRGGGERTVLRKDQIHQMGVMLMPTTRTAQRLDGQTLRSPTSSTHNVFQHKMGFLRKIINSIDSTCINALSYTSVMYTVQCLYKSSGDPVLLEHQYHASKHEASSFELFAVAVQVQCVCVCGCLKMFTDFLFTMELLHHRASSEDHITMTGIYLSHRCNKLGWGRLSYPMGMSRCSHSKQSASNLGPCLLFFN